MDESGFRHELVWDGVVEVRRAVRRHWRLLWLTAGSVIALALVFMLLRGPRYSAQSSFVPEAGESNVSRFAGLAAQLGLNLGGGGETPGVPVVFYSELLTSNGLLVEVARTRFQVALESGDTLRGTLAELLGIRGRDPHNTEQRVVKRLRGMISATTYRDAGLVRLRTTARWAGLAVALNRRMLQLVNQFNLERRRSRAGAEREFIERRVEETGRDLHAAEDQQRRFLERNRSYRESPELQVEVGRLQRAVDQKQQVYSQLVQGFEQARINEVRTTPIITLVDAPEGSDRRADRPLFEVALWLLLSGVIGVAVITIRESLDRYRVHRPQQYEELRQRIRPFGRKSLAP